MKCPRCQGSGEIDGHLGDIVATYRRGKGLSQIGLGKAADVTGSMISKIENDGREPSVAVLRRIASALGISAKDLLP